MADERNTHGESEAAYALLLEKSNKMKKTMIKAGAFLLGVVALLLIVVLLADYLAQPRVDTSVPEGTFEFYPPYEGDILNSEDYLALNRTVMYYDNPSGYGMGLEVTQETQGDFELDVWFLYEYIHAIVRGDGEYYNSFFNDAYFRKNARKSDFAQQMIYEAAIYFKSESLEKNGDKLVTYRLEYKIHRNNGEFRTDVGSDGIRPQNVTVRVSVDGTVKIESLVTVFKN